MSGFMDKVNKLKNSALEAGQEAIDSGKKKVNEFKSKTEYITASCENTAENVEAKVLEINELMPTFDKVMISSVIPTIDGKVVFIVKVVK